MACMPWEHPQGSWASHLSFLPLVLASTQKMFSSERKCNLFAAACLRERERGEDFDVVQPDTIRFWVKFQNGFVGLVHQCSHLEDILSSFSFKPTSTLQKVACVFLYKSLELVERIPLNIYQLKVNTLYEPP